MRMRRLVGPILFAGLGIALCGQMLTYETTGANFQTSENSESHTSDGSVAENVDSLGVGAATEDDPVESHFELRPITGSDSESEVNQPQVIDPDEWHEGVVLIVTNNSMDENGEDWSPETLIANPGPDGISLREALNSINSIATDPYSHETITFDPSLMGAVITVTTQQAVFQDGLTIDGDIDDDGVPDIILEGLGQRIDGLWIQGASHVIINGLHIRNFGNPEWGDNFGGGGIGIVNDVYAGVHHLENIAIRNNVFTNSAEGAIDITLQDHTHASIRNVEIMGNTFDGFLGGITIIAGQSVGTSDNEISHVSIISNTFDGGGVDNSGGIGIRAAGMPGNHDSSRNLVHDIEIRGNTITGTTSIPILVDTANRDRCNDNTISNLMIAENVIYGSPMNMEFVSVGENGTNSTGNLITDVTIVDNLLTGGGIQLSGPQASGAYSNTISNILVERNHITGCANAGVIAYPGAAGSVIDNVIEDVTIRNNYVGYCDGVGILLDCPNGTCGQGNAISNVDILNNTLVGNGFLYSWAGGLRIDNDNFTGAISNVAISNTILWGNSFDDALVGPFDLDQVTVANSIISDTRYSGAHGNFYADPQFANPTAGDFRLQPTSPCVDAGDPAGVLIGPLDLNRMIRLWDGDDNGSAVVDCGAWEYGSQHLQEIAVLGEGYLIPDDDRVPIPWDGTDFRSAIVAGETITRVFIIQNTGTATLTLTGEPRVSITGTNAAEFSVTIQPTSTIIAGAASPFTVVFDPSNRGLRSATISIDSDDIDENPYTYAIQGIGTKPEMEVTGNEILIADEDTTPSEQDGTDFGTAIMSGDRSYRWYEIWNTGTTTLTLPGNPVVAITGTHAADFTVTVQPSSTLGIGTKVSFEITFQPNEEGLRSAIVSIANNDDGNNPYTFAIQGTGKFLPTLQFSETAYHYPESANFATITVTLDASTTETVTVEYSTTECCTATAHEDYHPVAGMLAFAPGETLQTFEVGIIDDTVYEGFDESLLVALQDATNALGTPNNAALYIDDDDSPPVVSFSAGTYDVNESDSWITIPVILTGDTAVTATVTFSTTDEAALTGIDYMGVNGTLVYSPGVISQTITIPIIDDSYWEETENFMVTLLDTEHASGIPVSVTISIHDDDEVIIADFSAQAYLTEEDAGIVPITITLSSAYELTVTVTYSSTDGTATAGLDYFPLHGTLVFSPGVTSRIFELTIIEDLIGEDDETIIMTISDAENAIIGTNNPAILTIVGGHKIYLPLMARQYP